MYHVPVPILSLQERQALKCFAAFFTLSPFACRNRSTQALLQNFSYIHEQKWPTKQVYNPKFQKNELTLLYMVQHNNESKEQKSAYLGYIIIYFTILYYTMLCYAILRSRTETK